MERSFYAKFIKPFISLKTRETMLKLAYSYYISYRSAGSFKEYVKGKLIYIFQYFLPNTEKYNLYAFMGKYGFCHFPYPFTLQYRPEDVVVYFDEDWLLPYVLHQKKKLYYPIEDITNYEIQIA